MKDQYLIGELAQIFNISTDTLRHYDRIGLLKANQDKTNKYRYYSTSCLFTLSRILFLKSLDISLKDIQKYMDNKNLDLLTSLLDKKHATLEQKIQHLQNLKHKIESKQAIIDHYQTHLGQVTTRLLPERKGIYMKAFHNNDQQPTTFRRNDNFVEMSSWLVEGEVLTSIDQDNLLQGHFNRIRYFIEIDKYPDQELVHIPEHLYACLAIKSTYKDFPKYYKTLTQWIKDKGYQICGDAFENNIIFNDFSDASEEVITELQVPIQLNK